MYLNLDIENLYQEMDDFLNILQAKVNDNHIGIDYHVIAFIRKNSISLMN